jgi:hypothetical protein
VTWPAPADRPLVEIMRGRPGPVAGAWRRELVERAESHGLADVVIDAWERMGVPADDVLVREASTRRIARELDHAAHLGILKRIDVAFGAAGLRAVALKGVLFAERYYERPAYRGTTDVDLLVRESDLEAAARALATVGYRASEAESEERFRREHHHLHFLHDHAAELELHFHAYRGFGETFRSEDLLARSVTAKTFDAIRVLTPEDELVYLAVHAAAHRFGRLSWLYDLRLLVDAMTDEQLAEAARRARALGFAGPLALAGRLLVEGCAIDRRRVEPLVRWRRRRLALAAALAPEPQVSSLARSATRFADSLLLCSSPVSAARYTANATRGYARRLMGRGP